MPSKHEQKGVAYIYRKVYKYAYLIICNFEITWEVKSFLRNEVLYELLEMSTKWKYLFELWMVYFVGGINKQEQFLSHAQHIVFHRTLSYVDMKKSAVRVKTLKTNFSGFL